MSSDDMERDLRDVRSKIGAAKRELEAAARWEEDPEQERVSRHHAEELAVAMDVVKRYIDAESDRATLTPLQQALLTIGVGTLVLVAVAFEVVFI